MTEPIGNTKRLTREQILSMPAGRELDALVAEHVFKWRKVHGPETDYDGPCESFDVLVPPTIEDPLRLYPPKGAIKPWWFCKNWSTDLSAAMDVEWKVRQLDAEGYATALTTVLGIDTWNITTGAILKIAHATALDRCKAALLAVMEL